MGENRGWSWVAEDGAEHKVSEDELTFALSSEELPAYILVCRDDWAEWLPAMQVAELRWALPAGQADTPRKPELLSGGVRDNPPLGAYKTLKFRAKEIAAGRISPQFETALALSPAQPRVSRGAAALTPYSETDADEPTVQLEAEDLQEGNEVADALTAAQAQYAMERSRSLSAAQPPPATATPPLATRATVPPRSLQGLGMRQHGVRPNAAAKGSRTWLIAGVAVVVAAGGVGAFFATRKAQPPPVVVEVAPPAAAPAEPSAEAVSACRIHQGPARLGEFAKADLRPGVAALASGKIAVGYGQTSRYAMGLVVDPKNLTTEKTFSDYQNSPLLSVTPRVTGSAAEFLLERAASPLQSARTIPATPPFTLGVYHGTLSVRADKGQNAETIWNSPFETFSVPEVVRVTAKHHATATRGGGERGAVLVGTLQENGKPLGALSKVASAAERVGEPSLAISPPGSKSPQLLVGFSGGAQSSRESLYVARSVPPALPQNAQPLPIEGAPLGDPSVGALSDGSFVVQWSEGTPGRQSVNVALFHEDLTLVGSPIRVSGSGVDARDGTIFVGQDSVLSLYMVRNGQNNEMWAAVLKCE